MTDDVVEQIFIKFEVGLESEDLSSSEIESLKMNSRNGSYTHSFLDN